MAKFRIGDKQYDAPGSGERLGKIEFAHKSKTPVRFVSWVETVALTAVTGSAGSNMLLRCVSAQFRIITVLQMQLYALFTDNPSGATYNVSERASIGLPGQYLNQDTNVVMNFRNGNEVGPLDLRIELDANNEVLFLAAVSGGDVQFLTNITPAVDDTVTFRFQMSFIPD